MQPGRAEKSRMDRRLGRADKEVEAGVVAEAGGGVGQQAEADVDQRSGPECAGPRHDGSTPQLVLTDAGEIQRQAAAGCAGPDALMVRLHATDPRRLAAGEDLDCLADGKRAIAEGPGDDRAKAAKGEDAINREPRPGAVAARRESVQQAGERLAQRVQPVAGERGNTHDRGVGEMRLR